MQEQRIADRLAVVVLNFRQWSGETVLMKEDFTIGDGGQLPPQEVAHWGCKRICDPKELKVFSTIKQRAVRLLADVGVPFLGGMAIPLDTSDEILRQLDNFVIQYEKAKQDFLSRYDNIVSDWIAHNPGFSSELIQGSKTQSYVASRIKAEYNVFKVQPLSTDASNFSQAENGLGDKLLDEIAKTARELFKNSLAGKSTVTARVLNPIRTMRNRLMGLSFIDGTILPIVKTIDNTLSSIRPSGPYDGGDFHALNALVGILCDTDRMRQLSAVISAQSTSQNPSDFELSCTQETAQIEAEERSEAVVEPEPVPVQNVEIDPEDDLSAFLKAAPQQEEQRTEQSQPEQEHVQEPTEPESPVTNTLRAELQESDGEVQVQLEVDTQPSVTVTQEKPVTPVKDVSISEAATSMVFW